MGKKIIIAFVFGMLTTLVPMGGRTSTGHFPSLTSQGNDSGANIFEAYDETTPTKGRLERLDGFALYLELNPSVQAYVISYGGRRSCRDEALRRARFAKNYLSKVKSIDRKRITVLDGGYLDSWAVQLWFGAQGEAPPKPRPTIDRRGVEIIKICRPMTSQRPPGS